LCTYLESPEAAVLAVGVEFAEATSAMEDEYLAARADDVRDVAHQIASELMRGTTAGLEALEILSIDRLASPEMPLTVVS
jgi:phosphoenolpyruvate-protein phosphotransferase (PTS system enzyme I)